MFEGLGLTSRLPVGNEGLEKNTEALRLRGSGKGKESGNYCTTEIE